MSRSEEVIEAVAGAPGGEIELARVERELATLWAQAAPADPGAEPAVLRACSLNLLVLAHSPEELERARPVVRQTTLAHPSRILLVAPVPDAIHPLRGYPQASDASGAAPGTLNQPAGAWRLRVPTKWVYGVSDAVGAQISTFCHRLGGGGRHVCCEEITLLARGAAAGRLREAVLPLLVPDLPVFLWLPQSDASRQSPAASSRKAGDSDLAPDAWRLAAGDWRLASGVWSLADEVIWSARDAADALPAPLLRSRSPALVDLDWIRLQPWRELTAQWFDAAHRDGKRLLERLEVAEIEVAGPAPGRPGAGWLWIGWLASRLGWSYQGQTAVPGERRFAGADGPVTARVRVTPAEGPGAGEPLAVRLRLRGMTELLVLERQPADEPDELWITGTGGRCVRLGRRDEAALLSQALDGASRDRVYEAAWETAVQLSREG